MPALAPAYPPRLASCHRQTKETDIKAAVNLDGCGKAAVSTGVGFLDHMLEQLARHSLIDIDLAAKGDLHVDQHHVVEDSALALGEALTKALGDKTAIARYGHAFVAMDESLARVALDFSGRAHLVWKVELPAARLGSMDCELFAEWFHALARAAAMTLHVECLYGRNSHHIIEACYKALARALASALARDPRRALPVSTKDTSSRRTISR